MDHFEGFFFSFVFFEWIHVVKLSFQSHLKHVHHVFDKMSHSLLYSCFHSHLEHVHHVFDKMSHTLLHFSFFDNSIIILLHSLSQLHGLCLLILVVKGITNTLKHHPCDKPKMLLTVDKHGRCNLNATCTSQSRTAHK